MKKSLVLLVIGILCLSMFQFLHFPFSQGDTGYVSIVQGSPTRTRYVLVLVNQTIYSAIAEHLEIFEHDLALDGYEVLLNTIRNGLTPPEIRSIIKSYYDNCSIDGCILVGDIKAAYTETRTVSLFNSTWDWLVSLDAADMYYMDLDGYWENVTHPDFYSRLPPSVTQVSLDASCQTFYDEYIVYPNETEKWDYSRIDNKTQYRAEIWVSRIMGHTIQIPEKNEAQVINDFFEGDSSFRANQRKIEDSAYLLNAAGSGYNDQNMDYSCIFNSTSKRENVTKSDYLDYLANPNGSKLIYLCAHSCPLWHWLYETPTTITELHVEELGESNKTSVFYILNACSACRWDQGVSTPSSPNFLGGMYIFDKRQTKIDNGLGAIGFTGVGGFLDLAFFTDYLKQNPAGSYGDAYKYWFNEHLTQLFSVWCCVYLGDPTIGPKTPVVKPPSLSLLTPEIDGFRITVNGLTLPGNPHTNIMRISWDWGDGYSEDHWFPASHVFSNTRNFTATVTSYQTDGLSTSESIVIEVVVPEFPSPIVLVIFMVTTLLGCIVYRLKNTEHAPYFKQCPRIG